MDLYRWPTIVEIKDSPHPETGLSAKRFACVIEGQYPPRKGENEIFRVNVTIPVSRRGDVAFVASEISRAWKKIASDAARLFPSDPPA